MTDEEVITLVEMCSYMFGVHRIADGAVTAFAHILKSKFHLMKGEKVIQLCTEVAINPPQGKEMKFTPSLMATILQSGQKEIRPLGYTERETSITDKIKYRQEFLKDLSEDFELYKHGERTKSISCWDYVARQLVSVGYAERLPDRETLKRGNEVKPMDIFSGYKPFVYQCFDKMIKNNQHISDIINGLPS